MEDSLHFIVKLVNLELRAREYIHRSWFNCVLNTQYFLSLHNYLFVKLEPYFILNNTSWNFAEDHNWQVFLMFSLCSFIFIFYKLLHIENKKVIATAQRRPGFYFSTMLNFFVKNSINKNLSFFICTFNGICESILIPVCISRNYYTTVLQFQCFNLKSIQDFSIQKWSKWFCPHSKTCG